MTIVLDGLSVLYTHWLKIFVFFSGTLGMGVWLACPFTREHRHKGILTLLIGCPLGMIPLSMLVFLANLSSLPASSFHAFSIGIWVFSIILLFLWIGISKTLPKNLKDWGTILAFIGLSMFYLVLRLSFVKDLLYPPYSDSPFHVQSTNALLIPNGLWEQLSMGGYYHFSFHGLAAWLCGLSGNSAVDILPLIGQCLIFLIPLACFSLLLVLFDQPLPALLGSLMSAFAWSMPAFAANWGKYPSLVAACLLLGLVTLLQLIRQTAIRKASKIILLFLLAGGSILFHSRLAVVYALLVAAWLLVRLADRIQSIKYRRLLNGALCLMLLILLLIDPTLGGTYVAGSIFTLALFLIGLFFAAWESNSLTQETTLFAILWLVVRTLHFPFALPGGTDQLIDTPFTLIAFYVPLTILLTSGLKSFSEWSARFRLNKRIVQLFCGLCLLVNALNLVNYQPDGCCNWVREDDLAAFAWIRSNLPEDSVLYIAGTQNRDSLFPSDSGVWAGTITSLRIEIMSFDHAWFNPSVYQKHCQNESQYLYDSGLEQSFQIDGTSYPKRYQIVYTEGEVNIYQIMPCQP